MVIVNVNSLYPSITSWTLLMVIVADLVSIAWGFLD